MTLWGIAFKNFWQNRRRYMAYVASAAFSVMIYFLYTALVLHPQLQEGYRGAIEAVQGMKAASVVIAVFTLLFLLYSNSAFFRSRMKEFGMLSLLGVSKRQLIRIILWESLCIGSLAMVIGLALGLLFVKLFFMGVSVLMGLSEQIPFYAGRPVWIQTIAVFGAFFIVVSLASLRTVLSKNIIELVRAAGQPKETPHFSRWKAILGLLLLVVGYGWACAPNPMLVVLGAIPVTFIVSIGTYLLMREGSMAGLDFLHRREWFFYRQAPFLTVSQLIHKIQENYRVLTAVAILVAVILTAIGTIASLFVVYVRDAVKTTPHAIQLVLSEPGELDLAANRITQVLAENNVTDFHYTQMTFFRAEIDGNSRGVTVIPYSLYQSIRAGRNVPVTLSDKNEAVLITMYAFLTEGDTVQREEVLKVGTRQVPLQVHPAINAQPVNADRYLSYFLCVPDALFEELIIQASKESLLYIAIWDVVDWNSKEMWMAVTQLRELYPEYEFTATAENYRSSLLELGMLFFIGFFVSLVFLAACCSLLYFRLFTEIDDNRRYYLQLEKVGVSDRELKKLTWHQSLILFFTPFIAGLIHSTFAMQALGTLLNRTVLQFGWAVALGYLVLYGAFYLVMYAIYWRSLRVTRLAEI
ncbi:MAG TPA: ABC transporter permease [Firmicutes bacterium]|nr:ABC transporter permease [Bacillota bacterium]